MTDSVCLITAAVSTDFEDPEEAQSRQVRAAGRAPKLGILALAAILERVGIRPHVFDLDDAYAHYLEEGRGVEGFPAWVGPQIVSSGARLFGFSSLCSSYPLTIRLAREVKQLEPKCTVLLGGPQASATDTATLSAFSFVDYILRGEADHTLPIFLDQWSNARSMAGVPGLTWRTPFGVQRNPSGSVIDNLDDLPLPAFHLAKNLREADYAFVELGRGCPFSCTFCSTNDFFRRKFRVRSPQRVLEDMRTVAAQYDFRLFNLVHDMFTIDRRKVVAFCEYMLANGEGLQWTCSARTDCVDEGLLELMSRAGCKGVFFGVEAGSARLQKIIDKGLDPEEALRMITSAERSRLPTTVSLIVGFPEETEADLRETVEVFMHSMRQPLSEPQLNLLAPLAGTPIHAQYRDQLSLEEFGSQLSYPGRSQCDSDRDLVRKYPDIFPNFYLLPTPGLDRSALQEFAEFLPMVRKKLRWLMVAVHQRRLPSWDFFLAWREYRSRIHPEMTGSRIRYYYTRAVSTGDVVDFIELLVNESPDHVISCLLEYEKRLANAIACAPLRPKDARVVRRITSGALPVRSGRVPVVELDFDIQAVVDSLKAEAAPGLSPGTRYYRLEEGVEETHLVEITPLLAKALFLCDGSRTVQDFASNAGSLFSWPEETWQDTGRFLLRKMHTQGLIELLHPLDKPKRDGKHAMPV